MLIPSEWNHYIYSRKISSLQTATRLPLHMDGRILHRAHFDALSVWIWCGIVSKLAADMLLATSIIGCFIHYIFLSDQKAVHWSSHPGSILALFKTFSAQNLTTAFGYASIGYVNGTSKKRNTTPITSSVEYQAFLQPHTESQSCNGCHVSHRYINFQTRHLRTILSTGYCCQWLDPHSAIATFPFAYRKVFCKGDADKQIYGCCKSYGPSILALWRLLHPLSSIDPKKNPRESESIRVKRWKFCYSQGRTKYHFKESATFRIYQSHQPSWSRTLQTQYSSKVASLQTYVHRTGQYRSKRERSKWKRHSWRTVFDIQKDICWHTIEISNHVE